MWALRRVACEANASRLLSDASRILASHAGGMWAQPIPAQYRSTKPHVGAEHVSYIKMEQLPFTIPHFSTVAGDYKEEKLNVQRGAFETSKTWTKDDGAVPAPHPSKLAGEKGSDYLLMHPVYTTEYLHSIAPKHRPPTGVIDTAAYYTIQAIRRTFDLITGYGPNMTKEKWLTRVVFLETVAGVPGMVGGMIRHLNSLRLMRRDHGWIHTLLEEAENERMHLLTFLELKKPGIITRSFVLITQGVFCNVFFLAYLLSPTYCHRMVGYLEEEAVRTYTHLISDLESGKLPDWSNQKPPAIALNYWRLDENATMTDLILNVRADEACHSHVNHTFAGMKADQPNPFSSDSSVVP